VDGLQDEDGNRVKKVQDIAKAFRLVRSDKGEESVGGMKTKLEAVRKASSAGITAHILDGRKAGQIEASLKGKDVGTSFPILHNSIRS
jgi:glutamate 5-kinase